MPCKVNLILQIKQHPHIFFIFLEHLQPRPLKALPKGFWGTRAKKMSQSRTPKAASVWTCPKYCPVSLTHPL
jgi:hypothetical protein